MVDFLTVHGTLIIALLGVAIGLFNSYLSWRARSLAMIQERRKDRLLVPVLTNGYYKRDPSGTHYAFSIVVNNPSDNSNSISAADLAITYLNKDRVQLLIKLRANVEAALNFIGGSPNSMMIPASISAHGAIAGWLFFHLPESIRAGAQIEQYKIFLTDVHRINSYIFPILVQEYRDGT